MENPFPAENPTLQVRDYIVNGGPVDIHTGSMCIGVRSGQNIMMGSNDGEFLIDGRLFNLHHLHDDVRPYYNFSLSDRCQTVIDEILALSSIEPTS